MNDPGSSFYFPKKRDELILSDLTAHRQVSRMRNTRRGSCSAFTPGEFTFHALEGQHGFLAEKFPCRVHDMTQNVCSRNGV